MHTRQKVIAFLLLLLSATLFAQETKPVFSVSETTGKKYLFGLELAELIQNSFRNPGPENFTLHVGNILTNKSFFNFGWSLLLFNVQLSPEHIQDPRQAPFLTGDRENLSGKLTVMRPGWDFETVNFSFFPVGNRYLLRIIPIIGVNVGYFSFELINNILHESYQFSSITTGIRASARILIFDLIYFDYQFDLLYFLLNSNNGIGKIGPANIDVLGNHKFGIQGNINLGFIIKM